MSQVLSNPFAETSAECLSLTVEQYLELDARSRSDLWALHKSSPGEYRWWRTFGEKRSTDAMTRGSAIHCAVLEPDELEDRYCVYAGTRDKRHKKYQEFLAEHEGQDVLTEADWLTVIQLRDYVRSLKGVRKLFDYGLPEQTLLWDDPVTLLKCKSRPDWLEPDHKHRIVDLKSTRKMGDWHYMRTVKEHGYHVQGAMALDGCELVGLDVRDVWLLWVRTEGAPRADLTRIPEEAIQEGRTIYQEALALYRDCETADEWPTQKLVPRDLIWEV